MLSSYNCCDSKTVPIHKLMAAALLVLLLLLAVSTTAFTTTTDVYYVTADECSWSMSSTPDMPQPLLLHLSA